MEIKTRFMREVGRRAWLRIFWGKTVWADKHIVGGDCPNAYGRGTPGVHNAQLLIGETFHLDDDYGGAIADYPDDRWPTVCDHCDAVVPPVVWVPCDCGDPGCTRPAEGSPMRQIFRRTLYEAQDGTRAIRAELEPGDMYWADWFSCDERGGQCIHGWTNCDGKHLIVMCPDGSFAHPWDTNGRASNCTLPNETTHRCWVVHGNPEAGELVTVDKNGHTCGAGGGSIQLSHYHGVLSGGVLRGC